MQSWSVAVIDGDLRGVQSLDQTLNQVENLCFLVAVDQSREFRFEKLNRKK